MYIYWIKIYLREMSEVQNYENDAEVEICTDCLQLSINKC